MTVIRAFFFVSIWKVYFFCAPRQSHKALSWIMKLHNEHRARKSDDNNSCNSFSTSTAILQLFIFNRMDNSTGVRWLECRWWKARKSTATCSFFLCHQQAGECFGMRDFFFFSEIIKSESGKTQKKPFFRLVGWCSSHSSRLGGRT